ncbi:apolipoprotein Db [Pholidichthys leucotaenia]
MVSSEGEEDSAEEFETNAVSRRSALRGSVCRRCVSKLSPNKQRDVLQKKVALRIGKMFTSSVLLLLLPLISAQTYHWGPCRNPKVQPNFDLHRYLGRWYEIEKLPAFFERGKCIQANYALRRDGTIQVLNSQVRKDKREYKEGTAIIPDSRDPAKLGVSFSYFTPYSPYWVLTTDYDNISIVYSCTDILHIFHVDYAWILARTPYLGAEMMNFAVKLLMDEKIDITRMTPIDQSCMI